MVVKTLKELAEILHGELNNVEYSDIIIDEVTGLDAAFQHQLEHAITFAENEKLLGEVEKAGFAAVLLPSGLNTKLPALHVANARVAFAQALELFYPTRFYAPGIHPCAVVSEQAKVDDTAYIGPYAVVGDGAVIKEHAQIYAHAQVGAGSVIGAYTRLFPGASVCENVTIGARDLIGPLTVVADKADIGEDVEIGARCSIGTCHISRGVRIDNLVDIGDGASIDPLAIIISQNCLGENVNIGKFAIAAGQCLFDKERKVGDFATVAARSRVDKDIPSGRAVWSGDPVVTHKDDMRELALRQKSLHRWRDIQNLVKLPLIINKDDDNNE